MAHDDLPGILRLSFTSELRVSRVVGLKTLRNSSENVDSQAKPVNSISPPDARPRFKFVIFKAYL